MMIYDDFMYVVLQMVSFRWSQFFRKNKLVLLRDLHENTLMKLITELRSGTFIEDQLVFQPLVPFQNY